MISGAPLLRWLAACRGAVADLVYPWACAVCDDEEAGGPFCSPCRAELMGAAGPACRRCAMPVGPHARRDRGCSECRRRSLGFDAAVALGPYQGPIRHLCLRLKHERDAWLSRWMAELLVEARGDAISEAGPDWITYVPMHWRRRLARGHDQAETLALALAGRLRLPMRGALRRVEPTEKLAGLGRAERLRRMRGAFRARVRDGLEGKTVLLVDDILTTGATAGAAARALKAAGAQEVVVAVFARAEGRS